MSVDLISDLDVGQHPREAVTVAGILADIAPVLERLKQNAARRDQERELPYDDVRELAARRILWLKVPRRYGGAGGSSRDLFQLVIDIARADSNVAQALRGSLLASGRVGYLEDDRARDQLLGRIFAGHLFSGTVNERGGAAGDVSTTLRRDGDGFIVNGTKFYSTGGLYADWFTATAKDENGNIVSVTVPTDREGVERRDDFDGMGQRLTASGSTRLNNVRLSADEVDRPDRGKRNAFGPAAQLYLAAVEAGIAAAVLDDAIAFANQRARQIKHSSATRAVDDPYVRHAVGEISARANTARSVVLIGAEVLGQVWESEYDREGLSAVSVQVAEAQFIAAESALRAAELIFDVGGGTATNREFNFDRHWRNARVVANHNPRAWKVGVAGAYRLIGEEPPNTGLF